MPESNENVSGLPEVVRNANRPIVIYQVAPAHNFDVPTSNALGLISWLALLTLCLGVSAVSAWQVWNPSRDPRQFSPIYADGRPLGLAAQIEEREQINMRADGLVAFLDRLQADRLNGVRSAAIHPLISDRDGIDGLRRAWDEACQKIRARIYDRRIGEIDTRANDLRAQGRRERDSFARAKIDSDLQSLQMQRNAQLVGKQTDADPSLHCVPAAQAPACAESNGDPWCNPDLKRPSAFVDGVR